MMEWITSFFLMSHSPLMVYQNNKGLDFLKEEDKSVAISYYSNLLQEDFQNPYFLWNLSSSFLVNERLEAARKTLNTVIRLWEGKKDPMAKKWLFYAYFNKASILAAEKNTAKALEFYEKALEIFPNSKEVTVNIELLLKSKQGDGEGQGNQQKEDKKENQQDKKDKKDQKQKKPDSKPTPKPFKSKDLSKDDVRRILEELKRQEEDIRKKLQDEKPKQKSEGKDW